MDWTYAILLMIAGGLLAAGAILVVKKKQTRKTLGWIGAIGLIVGLVAQMGWIPQLDGLNNPVPFGQSTTVTIAPSTQGGVITGCGVEDTTVKLSALNKYTSGATSGTHAYRVNNGAKTTVSDAGTFSASPGDTLEVLFENEAAASTYFGEKKTYTVPCKGTYDVAEFLVQNGSFTMDVFDNDGAGIVDGVSRNVTLGAGDTVSLSFDMYGQNKRGFPHGGVLIVELNKTDFDEENTFISIPDLGGKLNKVAVPGSYAISNTANIAMAFDLPAFEGATKHTGTLFLDVDDTYNPGNTDDPIVVFQPKDYYIDEDNGAAFSGPSVDDEDNTQTYGHSTTTTISVD